MPTPPDFTTGQVLTAAMMDRVGLWKVIPTGATNGTVGANGTVTIGNAVASVTVSGAFGSDFTNYRILVNGGSASVEANIAMTLNGGTTAYYGVLNYGLTNGTGPFVASNNNAGEWSFVGSQSTTSGIIMVMEILGPNLAEWTGVHSTYISPGGGGTYTGSRQATTQHTGFTLTPAAGTMTGGTIQVYGYNSL